MTIELTRQSLAETLERARAVYEDAIVASQMATYAQTVSAEVREYYWARRRALAQTSAE